MVYLVLKELTFMADDVIIVMSSLTKDMNSRADLYRANAIRVLTGITDVRVLQSSTTSPCFFIGHDACLCGEIFEAIYSR